MPEENNRKHFPQIRGASPEIVRRAQELRRSMTPAEKTLWEAIRKRQLNGLRFRASHPIGRFILDFYCPAQRLAIEIDGKHHHLQQERDIERSARLEACGYRVIRFTNQQIQDDLPGVLDAIVKATH